MKYLVALLAVAICMVLMGTMTRAEEGEDLVTAEQFFRGGGYRGGFGGYRGGYGGYRGGGGFRGGYGGYRGGFGGRRGGFYG